MSALLRYFDKNGDGVVQYSEFVSAMREPMSARKAKLVDRVWAAISKDDCCDAATLDNEAFKQAMGCTEGKISRQDFYDFYCDVAMQAPSDDYFVTHMEQWWGLAEDEQSAVFKKQVLHVVAQLRQRLTTCANGSQEEFHLRKLFKKFDTNNNGVLSCTEVAGLLANLGVKCERKYLAALMKVVDPNSDGVVDYEEFSNFVINDTYK